MFGILLMQRWGIVWLAMETAITAALIRRVSEVPQLFGCIYRLPLSMESSFVPK